MIISMGKIISRLSLIFCLAFVLIFPLAGIAQDLPKAPWDINFKIIVNTIGNDGSFDFSVADPSGRVAAAHLTVNTSGNTGQADVFWPNWQNSFGITRTLPAGWKQTDVDCEDTQSGAQINYYDSGNYFVMGTIVAGDNNITCTVTNEYREEWLHNDYVAYLTVNTDTINGDGTFNYDVYSDAFIAPTPSINFDVNTAAGQGSRYVEWNAGGFPFFIEQKAIEGWQTVSIFCEDTVPGAQFDYTIVPGIIKAHIKFSSGYNRVTCTFTNKKIGEIITSDQEWAENKTIDRKYIIKPGATLTVRKGVQLDFAPGGGIETQGTLVVKGTKLAPVIFKNHTSEAINYVSVVGSGLAKLTDVDISGGGSNSSSTVALGVVAAAGTGAKLEIQGSNFHDNNSAISLNGTSGPNVKVNRTLFSNNQAKNVVIANQNGQSFPDFRHNWWNDYGIVNGQVINTSPLASPNFHDPVIIVPGLGGSWPEHWIYGKMTIDPITHVYDNLYDEFVANGYSPELNLFTFPYEWRDSNIENAKLLRDKINEIKQKTNWPKVDIVAHSMGGLLARQYIESDYYQDDVDQLITLATPNNGSPQAYLMWEGGEVGPGFFNLILQQIFDQEASEAGANLFHYVRLRPVNSIQELLPIYSYLRDKNSNTLMQYPYVYAENDFLEKMNSSEVIKKLDNIEYDKIIGNLNNNVSTISGYNTIIAIDNGKWVDGYPDGFYLPIGPKGLIKSNGDTSVPLESAKSDNVPSDYYSEVNASHNDVPTEAQKDVLELLTGMRPQNEVRRHVITNILVVSAFSPIDLQIVDSSGRRVGKDFATGQILNEIPGAYYTGYDTPSEFLTIPNPGDGEYKILTQGTGSGSYTIEATKISQDDLSSDATESTANIQGSTILGQQDQSEFFIQGDEVKDNNDVLPPQISCGAADGQWHNTNIAIACSATDDGSGLADMADANFTLSTNIDDGAETDNAATDSKTVCDKAGNCTTAGPIAGNKIDRRAPEIGLGPDSGSYDAPLTFNWDIVDSSSGINAATCGVKIDDIAVSTNCSGSQAILAGTHSVIITASDNAGNIGSDSRNYTVKEKPATLTIVNNIVPATDGGKFNLLIDGVIKTADAGNGGTTDPLLVASGNHTVSVAAGIGTSMANYVSVIGGDCAASGLVAINPGDNKTCTVINTRKDTGTLIINKKSGAANGTFNFKVTGPTPLAPSIITASGTGTTGSLALNVGQYTLSEIVPAGWSQTGLSCSVSCSGSCSSSITQKNFVVSFKIQKNSKVTCTFTNRKK